MIPLTFFKAATWQMIQVTAPIARNLHVPVLKLQSLLLGLPHLLGKASPSYPSVSILEVSAWSLLETEWMTRGTPGLKLAGLKLSAGRPRNGASMQKGSCPLNFTCWKWAQGCCFHVTDELPTGGCLATVRNRKPFFCDTLNKRLIMPWFPPFPCLSSPSKKSKMPKAKVPPTANSTTSNWNSCT